MYYKNNESFVNNCALLRLEVDRQDSQSAFEKVSILKLGDNSYDEV